MVGLWFPMLCHASLCCMHATWIDQTTGGVPMKSDVTVPVYIPLVASLPGDASYTIYVSVTVVVYTNVYACLNGKTSISIFIFLSCSTFVPRSEIFSRGSKRVVCPCYSFPTHAAPRGTGTYHLPHARGAKRSIRGSGV